MLVEITGKKNNEILTTTSRKVAEVFEKRHDHVLRDIENLMTQLGSPQNWGNLFIISNYVEFQKNMSLNLGFSLFVSCILFALSLHTSYLPPLLTFV